MAIGDSYYITHDIDAFDDIKIIALCDEFGLEAYAIYWLILEKMFPEESISLPYNDMTFRALKAKSKANCDIKSLVDRAIEYELFVLKDGQFYSPSFVRRMETHLDRKAKRSEAGRKGGKASAKARKQKKESQASSNESSSKDEAMLNDCSSKRQANVKQNQANEIEMKRNELSTTATSAHAREDDPLSEVITLYAREIDPIPSTVVVAHLDALVKQGMEPGVMLHAINQAASANARNWNYVRTVLDSLKKDKALTMEAVAQRERKFQASKGKKQGDKSSRSRDNRDNFNFDGDRDYAENLNFEFRTPRLMSECEEQAT
jgi:DnaD/phage-associated family protein